MLWTWMTIDKFITSWDLQLLLWVFLRWTYGFKRTCTGTPKLVLLLLQSFCLGGPIFSLLSLYFSLLISSAIFRLNPVPDAMKVHSISPPKWFIWSVKLCQLFS